MAAKKLFGTSGIRGLVGSEVTCELALNVGKSLAYYLGNEGTVVLGYDTRTTNDMLDQAICAGLLERMTCLTRQFVQDFWKVELMWLR